jgi:hypothetical protein
VDSEELRPLTYRLAVFLAGLVFLAIFFALLLAEALAPAFFFDAVLVAFFVAMFHSPPF